MPTSVGGIFFSFLFLFYLGGGVSKGEWVISYLENMNFWYGQIMSRRHKFHNILGLYE